MKTSPKFGLLGATVLFALAMAAPAHAASITFNFTAKASGITGTQEAASGLVALSADFANLTGSFSFDSAVPASSSTSTTANYPTGALAVDQFDVGTGVFSAPFAIFVQDDPSDGDRFALRTGGSTSGTPAGTYDLVSLTLADLDGAALTSTGLPGDLSLFATNNFLVFERFRVAADGATTFLGSTIYTLNSIELAATPVSEPTTLALMGLGLAAMGYRVRRRQKI